MTVSFNKLQNSWTNEDELINKLQFESAIKIAVSESSP